MSKQTSVPPRGGGKTPPRGNKGGGNRRPPKRRPARSQGRFYGLLIALVIAIVAVVVVVLITSGGSSTKVNNHQVAINWTNNGTKVFGGIGPEGVPSQLGTPLAEPNSGLTGATVAGVSCNTGEMLQYHHHIHLSIFINGQLRPVPLGVGMTPPATVENTSKGPFAAGSASKTDPCLYWLHVHAQDGIVHIESPSPRTFLLGQFFGVWNVALSPTQIGQYNGTVTATVNGQTWTGDPSLIPMEEHSEVVLNLGAPVVSPPAIDWTGTSL